MRKFAVGVLVAGAMVMDARHAHDAARRRTYAVIVGGRRVISCLTLAVMHQSESKQGWRRERTWAQKISLVPQRTTAKCGEFGRSKLLDESVRPGSSWSQLFSWCLGVPRRNTANRPELDFSTKASRRKRDSNSRHGWGPV
jgi:hypothetical protein